LPLIIWYQQLLVATDLLLFVISTINFENPKNSPKLPRILVSGFVEFFMVLIHRVYVLGVDLHFHKFSSPNSLYFGRNRRFFIPISAQIDEFLAQYPEPAKAGLHTRNSQTVSNFLDSKSANRLKPTLRPAKAGAPAKAGPAAGQHLLASDRSAPPSSRLRRTTATYRSSSQL
jgi:hypothetical protein